MKPIRIIRLFVVQSLILMIMLTGAEASKRILVDLTQQIAIAYEDGKVKFYGRISSGKPGRDTPTGTFYVREKDIDHVSNLWPQPNGGAKMPYMLRITRDGVAMHLGNTPNYPASHGCIRMQNGFAQKMYAWADKYTKVDIIGKAPAHSPAVKLPAYARSAKILRRSIGLNSRGPLAVLNGHNRTKRLNTMSPTAKTTIKKRTARTNRSANPLDVLNSHSKAHRPSTRSNKRSKRYKRKRNHRRTPRHRDPLKAFR